MEIDIKYLPSLNKIVTLIVIRERAKNKKITGIGLYRILVSIKQAPSFSVKR